ncbi:sulfotransferase [Halioxenophilus sp. WMMB6]|uniref:sulfotransferase family protein n=1 Tax=Halioxenophilus sp. WMMB6 TaxID=3073815 RepID=UPI00295EC248|nr:sulfotransferase [Halioxenophilus sp. WMMB6]
MISVDSIIAAAEQQTGLPAKLEPAVLEGLNQYVSSLNREAPLTERGWQSVQGTLITNLSNRLRVEAYLAEHPQLLQTPIEKPLFVFGLPRTGTTLVINLLNEDPARRCFRRWESLDSVPPPTTAELSSGPRYEKSQQMTQLSLKYAPQIAAIHYEDADSPTECQFAMSQSFCAQYYEAIAEVPSYRQWFLNADYRPAFQYQKKLLQLLQAQAPGRWTLKNPWHPLFLEDLTQVYPDAQLVMTHRDPVDVVGSCCSLIKHVRAMMSDKVDLRYIGETMMDTFASMVERTLAFKAKHGWDSIYDLHYSAVMRDPIGEIKKVYDHFNEPWTEAAEQAMTAYLANNPKGKFGKHEYSLAEYGLTAAKVRERFADYCDRFAIAVNN